MSDPLQRLLDGIDVGVPPLNDIAGAAHARRRRHRAALVAAAAVVAVVAVSLVWGLRPDERAAPARPPVPIATPDAHHPATAAGNLRAARAAIADVAAHLVMPPGAQQVDSAPTAQVVEPHPSFRTGHEVEDTSYWTVPGDVDSVYAWLKAHAPRGTVRDDVSESTGLVGNHEVRDLMFWMPGTPAYSSPRIDFYAAPVDGHVGVRVTMSTLWNPPRPADTLLDLRAGVNAQITTYATESARFPQTTTFEVSGAAAENLAQVFNGLTMPIPGLNSTGCAVGMWPDDLVVFRQAGRPPMTVEGDCGGAWIVGTAFGLDGALHQAVLEALASAHLATGPHEVATRAEVNRLISMWVVPPGFERVEGNPGTAALNAGPAAALHQATAHRYWEQRGTTVSEVLAYVRTHPPAGTTVSPGGPPWQVRFVAAPTSAYSQAVLTVGVVAYGPNTLVRADAFATWRAP